MVYNWFACLVKLPYIYLQLSFLGCLTGFTFSLLDFVNSLRNWVCSSRQFRTWFDVHCHLICILLSVAGPLNYIRPGTGKKIPTQIELKHIELRDYQWNNNSIGCLDNYIVHLRAFFRVNSQNQNGSLFGAIPILKPDACKWDLFPVLDTTEHTRHGSQGPHLQNVCGESSAPVRLQVWPRRQM